MRDQVCIDSVCQALQMGYPLIDTASGYRNQGFVGEGVRKSGVARESFWIQTKIGPKDQGYELAKKTIQESLKELGTYIDLFLIHWPGTQKLALNDPKHQENRLGTWKALEEAVDSGKVKAIGVSNYHVQHLEHLLKHCRIKPVVNQIECHPLYHPIELIEYCKKNDIAIQAYSSLGEGKLVDGSISLPILDEIAQRHQVPKSQVLLAWGLCHGYGVLPKASSKQRLESNLASVNLSLSPQELIELDKLATSSLTQKFCWDSIQVA